jgi:hypothetical protein
VDVAVVTATVEPTVSMYPSRQVRSGDSSPGFLLAAGRGAGRSGGLRMMSEMSVGGNLWTSYCATSQPANVGVLDDDRWDRGKRMWTVKITTYHGEAVNVRQQ